MMAVQLSSSLPPLNPLFLEEPEKKALEVRCKNFTYTALSVICIVASIAIFGVVLAIGLGLLVFPPWVAPILLALIFAEIPLAKGIEKFWSLSRDYGEQYALERDVAKKFKELASWEQPQIDEFAASQNIPIGEGVEKEQLLRAIAYILLRQGVVEGFKREFVSDPADVAKKIEEITPWEQSQIDSAMQELGIEGSIAKEDLAQLLVQREVTQKVYSEQNLPSLWSRIGDKVYPAYFESAFALQILANPRLQNHPRDCKIDGLSPRQASQRIIQQCYTNSSRGAMSQLVSSLNSDLLRQELGRLPVQALDQSGSGGDAQNGKGLG